MKKLIFLAISCLVALSGMAQAKVYSFSLDNNKHLKASMAKAKPAQRHAKAMTAEKPEGAVIWEDFSKFTAGSEDAPDATDVNDPSTGAIPDDMTLTPGWEGMGIKQAGGIAYVGTYDEYGWDETGYLKTSPADLSANGGTCTVRFRAKSASTEGDQVAIRLANPTNTYIGEQRVELTAEWQDYEVKLNNGTADAFIHFYSVWHEWYIDDLGAFYGMFGMIMRTAYNMGDVTDSLTEKMGYQLKKLQKKKQRRNPWERRELTDKGEGENEWV